MAKLIKSTGPVPSMYMVVAERPGKEEASRGHVLCGPSGKELDRYLLTEANVDRANVYCTNLVKDYRDGANPEEYEVHRDWPLLVREIQAVRPRYILLMGLHAVRAFLGPDVDLDWCHGLHWEMSWPEFIGENANDVVQSFRRALGIADTAQTVEENLKRADSLLVSFAGNKEEHGDGHKGSIVHQSVKVRDLNDGLTQTAGPKTPEVLVAEQAELRQHRNAESSLTCSKKDTRYSKPYQLPHQMTLSSSVTELPTQFKSRQDIKLAQDMSGTGEMVNSRLPFLLSYYPTELYISQICRTFFQIKVLCCIHTAAGLHQPASQVRIAHDFRQFGKLIHGQPLPTGHLSPQRPRHYSDSVLSLNGNDTIAMDTEGSVEHPWGLSYSIRAGQASVQKGRKHRNWNCKSVNEATVVMHGAMHDLPVLARLGVRPVKWECTLLKAALLGVEPHGLKALARRHLGLRMDDYSTIVREARRDKALEYLSHAIEWAEVHKEE